MKLFIKAFLILLILCSCESHKYLLKDENNKDKKFLINKIKEAKSNGQISSEHPIIVVDGVPYRYNVELKKSKLNLSKSDIQKIDILKKNVGIALYGDIASDGVLIVYKKQKTFLENNDSLADKNVLIFVDGKKISLKDLEKINPNDINTITVIKNKEDMQKYTSKEYDGVIIIEMKKD